MSRKPSQPDKIRTKMNAQDVHYAIFKENVLRNGFNSISCNANSILKEHFGFIPSFEEIKAISKLLSKVTGIPYTREYSREKLLNMYWLDIHYETLQTHIRAIAFQTSDTKASSE